MTKTVVAEGRTSTEAIEKGLKELGVSKDKVDIKVLESEDKRSFFSILAPRVVKVELTVKEGVEIKKHEDHNNINHEKHENYKKRTNKEYQEERPYVKKEKKLLTPEELEKAKQNLSAFLDDFTSKVPDMNYNIHSDEEYIYVDINGEDASNFIGYRGETLNALQSILSSIANKHLETKAHVILNIENYREKRQKALEELADKLSKTVVRTGRQVALEPMSAYERKVIHNRLQNSDTVKTFSVGEEPYRKVVIAKK